MFKNLKIGTKLVGITAIAFALSVVVLISVVSNQVTNTIKDENNKLLNASVNRYANYMSISFNELYILLESLSVNLGQEFSRQEINLDDIKSLMGTSLDSSNFASHIFLYVPNANSKFKGYSSEYLAPNGEFMILLKDENIDKKGGIKQIKPNDWITQRNAIKQTQKYNKPYFGAPRFYELPDEQLFGINFSYPLFDKNGNNVASLGIVCPLDNFNNLLQNPAFNLYKGNHRTIITKNGDLLSHQNKEIWGKNLYQFLGDSSSKIIKDAINSKKEVTLDDKFLTTNGLQSYIAIKEFRVGDIDSFYMIVTAPKDEVLKSLTEIQIFMIVISIIAILVISAFLI